MVKRYSSRLKPATIASDDLEGEGKELVDGRGEEDAVLPALVESDNGVRSLLDGEGEPVMDEAVLEEERPGEGQGGVDGLGNLWEAHAKVDGEVPLAEELLGGVAGAQVFHLG